MDNIIAIAASAEEAAGSFAKRIAILERQVTAREQAALSEAERLGKLGGEQDAATRAVVRQATRNQAQRSARAYRRELAATTEAERTERLQSLAKMEAKATALAPMFQSPVQLLSRQGLGTPERTNYTAQLAAAGPRELANYADYARHSGNRILAAAVLGRLDTLPGDQRPFRAREFAEAFVGEEFKATRGAIDRIRLATQRAVNANRAFESGRVDATAKISMGLAARRASS